jgi:hypothetical protein
MYLLNRLATELSDEIMDNGTKPVQVLSEDGNVFDIVTIEHDPEAGVTYIKVELAE